MEIMFLVFAECNGLRVVVAKASKTFYFSEKGEEIGYLTGAVVRYLTLNLYFVEYVKV